MELQEVIKIKLTDLEASLLKQNSVVKIYSCTCNLCKRNGLNGAPKSKTITEIYINRSIYKSLPHEDGIYEILPSNHYSIKSEPTLEEAIKVLQKHLREDKSEGSYYHSWMCNISMSIYDKFGDWDIKSSSKDSDLHEFCNQAAKNFLDNLIKE